AGYSPIFTSFIPQLSSFDNISAHGRLSTNGIDATIRIPSLVYNGNEFSQMDITATPSDSGLQVIATAHSIKRGSSLMLNNVRLNALASGNNVNFTAATDDQRGRSKYRVGGLFTVNAADHYSISLSPDNLLL